MSVVLDASAVLAALNGETGGDKVDAVIDGAFMSTVNLAEVASILVRAGEDEATVRTVMASLPVTAVAPDRSVATDAGLLYRTTAELGLSLGDRFCLALARQLDMSAMTADRAWAGIGPKIDVSIEMIR